MEKLYFITSLDVLANAFVAKANLCRKRKCSGQGMSATLYEAEANIWSEAAMILRQTTLLTDSDVSAERPTNRQISAKTGIVINSEKEE